MLYRRKLLLALLEQSGGQLQATRLQKYTFEIAKSQVIRSYDFVPYKYGCYSFDIAADLATMKKQFIVTSKKEGLKETWSKLNGENFFDQLKLEDQYSVSSVSNKLDKLNYRELIRHIYINDPYYAIRSEIADQHLSSEELNKILKVNNTDNKPCLADIGYEGVSLDEYLNRLIKANVHILCDIRRNAFSMKRGFSKSQLRHACEQLGIEYVHLPNFGIASEKRKELNSRNDYMELFHEYRISLKSKHDDLEDFSQFFKKYKRIAVTCFEADHTMCHRNSFVREYIKYAQPKDLVTISL